MHNFGALVQDLNVDDVLNRDHYQSLSDRSTCICHFGSGLLSVQPLTPRTSLLLGRSRYTVRVHIEVSRTFIR